MLCHVIPSKLSFFQPISHWSYFRIKILMTECHESFSFRLKKFWHDRVPPLTVLKSMWKYAAILVKYSWKGREVALSNILLLINQGSYRHRVQRNNKFDSIYSKFNRKIAVRSNIFDWTSVNALSFRVCWTSRSTLVDRRSTLADRKHTRTERAKLSL